MRLVQISLLLLFLCCLMPQSRAGNEKKAYPEKRILMLVSYHMTDTWTDSVTAALQSQTRNWPSRVIFDIIELDGQRSSDSDAGHRKFQSQLDKLRNNKYDMILALDDPAVQVVLAHYAELPPQLPIVFAGFENYTPELRQRFPNVTGVTQNFNPVGSIEAGLALYPQTRHVVMLSDNSETGRKLEAQVRQAQFDGVSVTFLHDTADNITDLFEQIRAMPEHTLLLLACWERLQENDYQNISSFGLDLADAVQLPYLVGIDSLIGYGALGGYLTPATKHGEEVAEVIAAVLSNGGAQNVPVRAGFILPVFDYNMLTANALDANLLPQDAVVVNQPPTLWQAHRQEMLLGLVAFGMLLCSGLGYVFLNRRAVRRSMKLYRALPGRIGACNRNEKILFLHNADEEHQGLKITCLRDIPNINYEKVSAAIATVFQTGQPMSLDYEYRNTKRAMTIAPLAHGIFGSESVVWFSHDNTELQKARAQAEDYAEKLKKATRMWDIVINALPLHIFVKDASDDLKYIFSNLSLQNLFGCSDQEICGKTDFDFFPAELAESFRATDRQVMAGPESGVENTVEIQDHNGNTRQLRAIRRRFIGEDGSRLLLGATLDITELHKARIEAEEAAEHFKLTLRSIGDAVLVTDRNGCITMLNPVAERLTGWSLEEALGKPHEEIFKIVSYVTDLPVPSPLNRSLANGEIVELANHTDLLGRDGLRWHIADSAAPIRNSRHEIIGGILVFRDVTEEYDKRDQLRNALRALDYASELSGSASFRLDRKTNRISGSKLLPTLWPQHDGQAVAAAEWVHPDDLDAFEHSLQNVLNDATVTQTIDCRSTFGGGEWRYLRLKAGADYSNPQAPLIVGVIQDITEITRSSWKLKETLELWNLVIDTIPIMIFAKKVKDNFRYVLSNRFFAEFVGRPSHEIVGKDDYEVFNLPESATWFRAKDEEIMARGVPEEFLENPVDGAGKRRHLRTTKIPFLGADGEPLLLGVTVDVTELDSLIRSERITNNALAQVVLEADFAVNIDRIFTTLSELFSCDRMGFALYDQTTGTYALQFTRSGEGVASLHELPNIEQQQMWQDFHANIDRNELSVYSNVEIGSLSHRQPADVKSAIAAPIFIDQKLWAVLLVNFCRNSHAFTQVDENIMRSMSNIIALAQIRERQMRAIKQADYENQMILNNIRIPIWLHDSKGELLRANTAAGTIAGLKTTALDTRSIHEVMATGNSVQQEVSSEGRDYTVNAEPVFDNDEALRYIVKSAIDVTDVNAFIANEKVVNYCLETFLREEDVQSAINLVLETVCKHARATRCYILKFNLERETSSIFAEYAADGAELIFSDSHDVPFSIEESWVKMFERHEALIVPSLADPHKLQQLGSWADFALFRQMKSVYVAGIHLNGQLWGDIGLIYEDRQIDMSELNLNFLRAIEHLVELMLERKRSQEQIMNALYAAQAADKAKSFFIASVSHEIRTPLNAVIGFSELLRDSELDRQTQQDYLDSIAYSGNALLQLINDVLDLSKLEAGQMKIETQETDFISLCREVVGIFRYSAEQKKLNLAIQVPEMPIVHLDKLRIRQILFNLIGNAVKFTTEGEISIAADFVEKTPGVGTLSFSVTDSGCGISKDDQKALFEPFVQLSSYRGTNATNNGTGLGLAISQRLLDQMHGRITLESTLGQGSCFAVQLDDVRFESRRPMAATPEKSITGELVPCKILIVDDVLLNLRVLQAMLRNIGCDVMTADSGSKALDILETQRFDLVLADLWMPGMNGAELAHAIRRDLRYQGLLIIAVTADIESQINFDMTAFDDIITKPVTLEKLRILISKRGFELTHE